jgi:hypothetical protein
MKLIENYDRNVFINCPFDKDYEEIFQAILFTVHRCGYILRCAKEFQDSSSIRIKNIIGLINESKYSIHDLSRVTVSELGALPRFNMPLELGIFIGCNEFGSKRHRDKEYLIIESELFRFKQFISDLSGQDIKSHKNDPTEAIKCIRNWLSKHTTETIPSPGIIAKEYQEFLSDLPLLCKDNNWIANELTFDELSSSVTNWLTFNS